MELQATLTITVVLVFLNVLTLARATTDDPGLCVYKSRDLFRYSDAEAHRLFSQNFLACNNAWLFGSK